MASCLFVSVLTSLYCACRIADPVKFHSKIERPKDAEERIRGLLRNHKKEVVPAHNMADLVNTDPEAMRILEIEDKIFAQVRKKAMEDYGVEVVRVGIKSLGLAKNATAVVIEAMKEERQRYVQEYESAGDAKADAIKESAKAYRDQILAFAKRKAQKIRSEGDLAAAMYYSKFNENPGLSMFLRSLESLKLQLSGRVIMIVDKSQNPAVGFFREGPSIVDVPVPGGESAAPGKAIGAADSDAGN